ncbi:30S ribosomal protein S16 [Candidatus Azambacteria bacterium RIFCSPHIGHO2_01_FULL_44_55]|uniref:30S ribosomal protein S16 n=1 Tax=Candidatus Azambacteria bacterium RIFCSPLOWO2_02_FULL_44_14 TaxID=1797306 RepID=A0A1F5CCF7_9BACT|nr:MAG: 30S ribosomal protein S16 [Candidatus Azambacteria bacterium RIFCSPLOWO2_01_FULL_44_84]OGD32887.1 MAG: 30S ribosomal protein S16 [Candidatus Azambacteria bacterium RIFCSPHIGHO2_02_FULL_45_18]OGD40542.1 MAG: 30S ribosomal protein S16 [Candidatus Azambacteria bacterium RIFCSPLOWO2_02_FULL_44_14]OGD40901.1 MAG: 30S ribosomal protein S16 [Candidatus Azambacteria bacterium RIFCSPHIGHO2_01_FULL_44_55]
MLMIRLQRVGKIHTATFRVVVTEKTAGPRRQYLELVGTLDRKIKKLNLNKERILYWISKGAKPSDTVHNLLVAQGIITGAKIAVHQLSKQEQKPAEVTVPAVEIAPAETPAA